MQFVSWANDVHDHDWDVSKSTMSHHLRILREAGVTNTRIAGARRMLTLRRDDLDARFPGLLDAVLGAPDHVSV